MNEEKFPNGLRERIAKAGSPEEVAKLLDEGSTYTQASERTRASWRNTANRRLVELKATVVLVLDDAPAGPDFVKEAAAALKKAVVITSPIRQASARAQRRHLRKAISERI